MFKFLRNARISLVLLAVSFLLIFLHYAGILSPIENLIIRILAPVQHQLYSAGTTINGFYTNLVGRGDLKEENKMLKEKNEELTVANSQMKTLLEENQQLLVQKDFLENAGLRGITAKVIGRNPEPNFQSIIINKGSKDGIAKDFPIITAGGVIVGKVSEVRSSSAEVILINDSRSSIAAEIQNESKSKGVVVGEHGLSLKMELIPQNEVVTNNDIVITSGLEPAIPKGLVIGPVSRVVIPPNGFFQTAFLTPLVKPDNLTVVSVLITPINEQ